MKAILYKAFFSSWIIIKLVVPFTIVSDLLQYFKVIDSISFIFEPFTNSLNLPSEVAVSFASAIFFNLYAGIAIASTLELNAYQWTIVGTFMAICHSLPLESAVLQKVGMNIYIHWVSRLILGYIGANIAMYVIPQHLSTLSNEIKKIEPIKEFIPYIGASISHAFLLAFKVILLVVGMIIFFESLKKLAWFKDFLEKHAYLSSLSVGGLLGITYGAGILLQEIKRVQLEARILLIVFLMIAHGLIEETLIFAFFQADIESIFLIRMSLALIVVSIIYIFLKYFVKKEK